MSTCCGTCMRAKSLQSCLTLCDLVDCSPPASSVHGILQVRILEWVAILSSRGSSRPRDQTRVSCGACIAGRFFTTEPQGRPPFAVREVQNPRLALILAASSTILWPEQGCSYLASLRLQTGLNCVPLKKAKSFPEPQDVTLFGDRMVTGIINQDEDILEEGES